MVSIVSILRNVVKLGITAIFILASHNKLYPFDPVMNGALEKGFQNYFGWSGHAHEALLAVGALEMASALLIWVVPNLAAFLLTATMAGAFGFHYIHNEPLNGPVIPSALLALYWILTAVSGGSKATSTTASKKQKAKKEM
eukprot:TRINITY_DN2193_c0_g2_i2.p1 TRINITY_DN2193_c0_g2~~TRINITY_DN2193_c0_g2_i2.p1  ORF type:complete len:141 (-),score=34.15 TRINITY_DN2193_c0_g2_i2:140-562(-)